MNSMIAIWPGNLNNQFLDSVIERCDELPIAKTTVGFDGTDVQDEYRKSDIRWLHAYEPNTRYIFDTLYNYALDANKQHFGLDVNYLRDVQYTTYKAENNGKYDWHEDVFWLNPSMFHRKLSVVVQLTDPLEYEGGEFQIDPQFGNLDQSEIKKRGTVIVFPSFLKHRVTPVTRGVRRSLVCWIEGPKFR